MTDGQSLFIRITLAIIVNKEKKRRNIAFACKDLLLENGINELTIAQIAKTAGVGKGTIYEYFENKEDIVFEIITVFIAEYEHRLLEIVDENRSTKEKLFHFFYIIHGDEEGHKQLRIYREFLAISMTHGTREIMDFNRKCRDLFLDILSQIIEKGVENGEIPEQAHDMKSALLTFSLGLVVDTHTIGLDPKEEINGLLNTLFNFIEMKEKR